MLDVRLTGAFEINCDGKPLALPSRIAQSLFAYLILNAGTAHRREKLAGLFWPDSTEERARASLRHELWRIRKAFASTSVSDGLLSDDLTVAFAPSSTYRLDVRDLTSLPEDASASKLIEGLAAYRGELLPGFYDDWVVLERERLQLVVERGLARLLDLLEAEKRWPEIVEWAERWLALGQKTEAAYRSLMIAYGGLGDRAKVLATYERCVQSLRELGLEPSEELSALAEIKRSATDRPSGTVTFLFTDIEGSTPISQAHRETWEAFRARHNRILKLAVEENGGHVFQIIGDAFCVAFHNPNAALDAAIEAQGRLQKENWGDAPIKVRMGINTGAAHAGSIADGSGGYTGYSALVRTQRVMSAAHGEQILVSNTSADLLLGELPAGVILRDMKEHRLKGLVSLEHLWQVVAPGLAQDFPALQTLERVPTNLPNQLTSFIGRAREIAEIKKLVEHNRLVTLTGSGGVGKTRHALEVGAELLDAFPDGVWLAELAPVSNPELALHAVASVMGVRADQARPLLTALQDHLASKNALVLLDNCEHLLEACAQLADSLLRACPRLRILATSREALGVAGEVSFRVPSLSLPDPQHLPSLEEVSLYDSVRLFVERAVAVKSDFFVASTNAPSVARVCSRLDGIPLAIELAAARVKGLSVEEISQRLDQRFQLLTGGSRTALPRHQTLRAMIEWSHDLLSETERALLRRLSVFVGDWTLDAAEAVCAQANDATGSAATPAHAGEVDQPAEVMGLLLRLVDKSLVVPEEWGGQTRYRMLETIRQFAREKLSESREEPLLRARHLDFFLKFSEQAEATLQTADHLTWLNQLGAEYENLQVALAWARETRSTQPAPRLAKATEQLADVKSMLGLGAQSIARYQEALELWRTVAGADRMIEARLHGKIVLTVADLKWRVDSTQYAALLKVAAASNADLVTALELVAGEPPSLEQARLLTTLSVHAAYAGAPADLDPAEHYARAAVEMAEKLGAPVEISTALGALADAYYFRGLLRERLEVSRRRLLISREPGFGDMRERIWALINAGHALKGVGEYAEALPHLLEAEGLAGHMQAVDLEKEALDLRIDALFWLDRWDEILGLDGKLREMQQRYPAEHIGVSCYQIAMIASIHGLRGEMELAISGREEANAIMTAHAGPSENWDRVQHY
jgi:predicted ATPase/DNA-binding SARP family transcriptional activator